MAKYEKSGKGNYSVILKTLHDEILYGNISSSIEEKSDFIMDNVIISIRTYDRVSISITTSGGSQAIFFKVNTFGENRFLNSIKSTVDQLIK